MIAAELNLGTLGVLLDSPWNVAASPYVYDSTCADQQVDAAVTFEGAPGQRSGLREPVAPHNFRSARYGGLVERLAVGRGLLGVADG